MSNMSYCRFTNTRQDMEDCLDVLRAEQRMSDFEAKAGRNMFKDILEFCRDSGMIEDFDSDVVDGLFQSLQEREEDEETE